MEFCCGFHLQQRNCLLFFFCKSAFGLVVVFFTQGRLFSLNGYLSLFSVKLCSAQKFMIKYDIPIIQYPWIYQKHIVMLCFCQQYCRRNKCKNPKCLVNICRIKLQPLNNLSDKQLERLYSETKYSKVLQTALYQQNYVVF